ncbi:MAG TPA: cytochrome P450 [Acidimicrobiales bacterium]|nr:cytochrome P450 [Acidimicrobiales bacterium]
MSNEIVVTTHERALEVYRNKDLRQGLYDDGDVVMSDVLVNLHGDAHRARRRLENRLFRRPSLLHYEQDLFGDVMETTLRPHVEAGEADLVSLGHQLMMNLAALTAGVDRPEGTPTETDRLYAYLRIFIEGATLGTYTGDRDAKRAEVADALVRFDDEFLAPAIERRTAILDSIDKGDEDESTLPPDVLSILLSNEDDLHLPHETVRREVAFYLLAGAHTSATAFTRVTHNILSWVGAHPADAKRAVTDREFVQRCTQETIRLEPSSPTAARWALADITLDDGTQIAEGDRVIIDLMAVNRDRSVWGPDAPAFDPERMIPDGVPASGLSFGHGMHHCIGYELAAGAALRANQTADERLWGLVPIAVQWLFDHGCESHPTDAPEPDESTTRPYFGRYPVVFA